jgi:hypothetical protein
MARERAFRGSDTAGVAVSLAAALTLIVLLHRALNAMEVSPDPLLLGMLAEVGGMDAAFLGAVVVACAWAVRREAASALIAIQWYSLGCGLFLMLYRLGSGASEKVDPRLVLAVCSGATVLYATYLCLLAHVALRIRRRIASRPHAPLPAMLDGDLRAKPLPGAVVGRDDVDASGGRRGRRAEEGTPRSGGLDGA